MVANDRKGRIFNPRGLVDFFLACLVLGILIAIHSKTIDNALVLLWLAVLCFSSGALLWRRWKHPAEFRRYGMSQLAVLPRRWRNWVLDENDKGPSRRVD